MDLQAALAHASEHNVANVVGLQLHGRSIEVYRPRFCKDEGTYQLEYREGLLFQEQELQEQELQEPVFQGSVGSDVLDGEHIPEEAAELDYFVAPISEDELDTIFNQRGEVILHRLLEGAPSPEGCESPREKAAFTSWCIATLAARNG